MNKEIFRPIANSLTLLRLFLILPITIALSISNLNLAFTLLLIASISDVADGFFARYSKTVSNWGNRYDPLADKIILISPLIWLVSKNIIPFWSLALILIRDLFITELRISDVNGLPASNLAKVKTILQFLSVLILILPGRILPLGLMNNLSNIGLSLYWLSFTIAMITFLTYFINKSEQNH